MGVEDLLTVRLRERAALLRRVEQVIRRDCRVRAAWIMGSVARGEDDALSDLDLFIVVADDSIAQFIDNRRVHAADRHGRYSCWTTSPTPRLVALTCWQCMRAKRDRRTSTGFGKRSRWHVVKMTGKSCSTALGSVRRRALDGASRWTSQLTHRWVLIPLPLIF